MAPFGAGLAGGIRGRCSQGWLSAIAIPRCWDARATRPARRLQFFSQQHTTLGARCKGIAGGQTGMSAPTEIFRPNTPDEVRVLHCVRA
ncbi:MAG: hypothetical protein OJF49_000469 [Ktedonobacterales bacterium]|nr:MAG: hypothetical protein OJF49_000469 [Ktedonobacterales bacterium]